MIAVNIKFKLLIIVIVMVFNICNVLILYYSLYVYYKLFFHFCIIYEAIGIDRSMVISIVIDYYSHSKVLDRWQHECDVLVVLMIESRIK